LGGVAIVGKGSTARVLIIPGGPKADGVVKLGLLMVKATNNPFKEGEPIVGFDHGCSEVLQFRIGVKVSLDSSFRDLSSGRICTESQFNFGGAGVELQRCGVTFLAGIACLLGVVKIELSLALDFSVQME
jgi:hypothetical protein